MNLDAGKAGRPPPQRQTHGAWLNIRITGVVVVGLGSYYVRVTETCEA